MHLWLDDKGEKVEFCAGRFKSKLSGIDSDQFSEFSLVKGESVKLPATIIYEGVRRTDFAVTDDSKCFTINGILFRIENFELKMFSTDGHRLCYFRLLEKSANGQGDNNENWEVAFDSNHIMNFFSIHGAETRRTKNCLETWRRTRANRIDV